MSDAVFICDAAELLDKSRGVRFPVTAGGEDAVAFVIRYGERPHAYLNRCAHVPMELDWTPGDFFESSGLYLMCATHGALYEPDTGRCAGGPCRGGRLHKISLVERDGKIFWQPDDFVRPPLA